MFFFVLKRAMSFCASILSFSFFFTKGDVPNIGHLNVILLLPIDCFESVYHLKINPDARIIFL
jgi:hypothetical protein